MPDFKAPLLLLFLWRTNANLFRQTESIFSICVSIKSKREQRTQPPPFLLFCGNKSNLIEICRTKKTTAPIQLLLYRNGRFMTRLVLVQ